MAVLISGSRGGEGWGGGGVPAARPGSEFT